jgi:hypothetical protein
MGALIDSNKMQQFGLAALSTQMLLQNFEGPIIAYVRASGVHLPDSGTSAWTEIFVLYPVTGASITHKLLARGLKTCLNFKNDSMASALDYIASVNVSASH